MLLPVIVSSQIEDKYELETIKATNNHSKIKFLPDNERGEKSGNNFMSDKGRDGGEIPGFVLQNKYEKAVTETEGKSHCME